MPRTGGEPAVKFSSPVHSPSQDTVETLISLKDGDLYCRLAAWLIDASAQDIAAYWNACLQKPAAGDDLGSKIDRQSLTELVLLNWTRLDPQAAISATAGTAKEPLAWWAWGGNDPAAALAAAIAGNSKYLDAAARGIGECHPDWLLKHLDEFPESARQGALYGLQSGKRGAEDPLQLLRFQRQNHWGPDETTFNVLVRKDLWSAWDWVKENPDPIGVAHPGGLVSRFVKQAAIEHPDDLARLAEQTPSGEYKRKMESALFDELVKTDPEAALAQAKATDIPRTAAERYAALGLSKATTDPEQAFAMARDLFTACPDALSFMIPKRYPGLSGEIGESVTIPGVGQLMNTLVAQDPARLTEVVAALPSGSAAFFTVAGKWVEQDIAGYTGWLDRQTNAGIRDRGTDVLIQQLRNDGRFAEAVDRAVGLKVDRARIVEATLERWGQANAAEAAAWLKAADLPAAEKAKLQDRIPPSP